VVVRERRPPDVTVRRKEERKRDLYIWSLYSSLAQQSNVHVNILSEELGTRSCKSLTLHQSIQCLEDKKPGLGIVVVSLL
jgi:hypothetical protein